MKKGHEKKERTKWTKKKKIIFSVFLMFVILIAVFSLLLWRRKKNTQQSPGDMPSINNSMITASGTTMTDNVIEELDIDSLETVLYVEEVYASSGQSVNSGDKILKITDESLEKARKELENNAQEAQIAYQQQLVTYETDKINAQKDADTQAIDAEYADIEYEYNLKQASDKLDELKEQVNDANDLVAEYTDAIDNNYYYTYYNVKELQDETYENFALLMKLYEDWNISDSSSQSSSTSQTSMGGPGGTMGGSSDSSQKFSIYADFDEEVSEEIKERDEAVDSYEKALKKAKYSIEDAKVQYELLNAELIEEQVSFEKEKITLKTTCDTTKAEAELAESSYETNLKKIQEELDTVEQENKDAQSDLKNFTDKIGDGYLYASLNGTIMMVNAKKSNALDTTMPLVAYNDTENVTISVAVEQADISKIEVGDSARAVINEVGTYDGTVISINPVSASDSRSSVSYEVIVKLTGDLSELDSNLTATIMFGNLGDNAANQNNSKMKGKEDEIENQETNNKAQRPDIQIQGEDKKTESEGKTEE